MIWEMGRWEVLVRGTSLRYSVRWGSWKNEGVPGGIGRYLYVARPPRH